MTAHHTPGPWSHDGQGLIYGPPDAAGEARLICDLLASPCDDLSTEASANGRLIEAAPRMAQALHRAAHLLAELPEQSPQLLALRAEMVETIKQATPEHYGATPAAPPQHRPGLPTAPTAWPAVDDLHPDLEHLQAKAARLAAALRLAAGFIESGESAGADFFEVRAAWRTALAD